MKLSNCPACSLISTGYRQAPLLWRLPRTQQWTIMACCDLSRGAAAIPKETPEQQAHLKLSEWWEARRKTHHNEWAREQLDKEAIQSEP